MYTSCPFASNVLRKLLSSYTVKEAAFVTPQAAYLAPQYCMNVDMLVAEQHARHVSDDIIPPLSYQR